MIGAAMIAGFPSIDFDAFHRAELPQRLLAGNGALAAGHAASLAPLGIGLAGSELRFSYVPQPGGLDVVAGDALAATAIELDQESFEGLVHDLEAPAGLIYARRVQLLRGDLMHFVRWEPVLRAMFTGRPIYDPARVDLRDRRGAPLEPTQAFRPDGERADMAHFLRSAGYLLVKGVFSPDEVERFRAGADWLRTHAEPGDQKSWWGRNVRGEDVLCRVLNAGERSEFRALHADGRIRALVDLADAELVGTDPSSTDGVTVLWKNPGMTEGLGDLPWHHDCGMGGHAAMCPTLICSIFLGPNTPEAGALHFLPGSWQSSVAFAEAGDASAPEGVTPPAEPGDLTLHYGDGKHAAPPPTSTRGPFRCCVLLAFKPAGAHHHRGERHYNDVLLGREDGQIEHLTRVAARRG